MSEEKEETIEERDRRYWAERKPRDDAKMAREKENNAKPTHSTLGKEWNYWRG